MLYKHVKRVYNMTTRSTPMSILHMAVLSTTVMVAYVASCELLKGRDAKHAGATATNTRGISMQDFAYLTIWPLVVSSWGVGRGSQSRSLDRPLEARGPKDDINIRILHCSLMSVLRPNKKGIPEIIICRILVLVDQIHPDTIYCIPY